MLHGGGGVRLAGGRAGLPGWAAVATGAESDAAEPLAAVVAEVADGCAAARRCFWSAVSRIFLTLACWSTGNASTSASLIDRRRTTVRMLAAWRGSRAIGLLDARRSTATRRRMHSRASVVQLVGGVKVRCGW